MKKSDYVKNTTFSKNKFICESGRVTAKKMCTSQETVYLHRSIKNMDDFININNRNIDKVICEECYKTLQE